MYVVVYDFLVYILINVLIFGLSWDAVKAFCPIFSPK